MFARIKSGLNRLTLLFSSIRFRLALWFVFILGIVVVAFSAFIYIRQVQELRAAAIGRLEIKARRLGGFLRFSSGNFFQETPLGFPVDPGSGISIFQEGDELAILDPNGQIVQNVGPIDAKSIGQLVGDALKNQNSDEAFSSLFISAKTSGGNTRSEYIMMIAPISIDGGRAGYFLIGNMVDPGGQLPRLFFSLILGILITLAIALAGGFWLADRAMRPVKTITHAAQAIGESDLSMRLHLGRKDELGELANTFDEMLARLQAAFERQRQFTADASHELRTPLTIVELESSRALAAQRSPEEYGRALKVIQSENQFMIRMVNNLLTLARMDAGQVILHNESLDLSDVALEVVERLAPLATNEQVRLSAGDLPELAIMGDRQYLVQMLSNLVENAIKYAKGEDSRVRVETGSRESESGMLAWARVSDNGPGILPDHLPHLFDRFYQVDKSRTRQYGEHEAEGERGPSGIGLGLSIAQWIAQAHGGEIHVQSETGKGSAFEVSLPMVASTSDASQFEKEVENERNVGI